MGGYKKQTSTLPQQKPAAINDKCDAKLVFLVQSAANPTQLHDLLTAKLVLILHTYLQIVATRMAILYILSVARGGNRF